MSNVRIQFPLLKRKINTFSFSLFASALLLLCSPATYAIDALQVLPTRVLMVSESSAELTLVNKGDVAGSYRILLRNIRTDDNGKFAHAEKAEGNELFADELIRFSPRQVTIEPGSFQKVRVMVRKPKDLKDGEYRTHIVFQTLPKQDNNSLDEKGDLSVSVDPVVEVSIPIIVRQGKLTAELDIQSMSLAKNNMVFTLTRNGTRSAYGEAEVVINSGKDKDKRVGFIRGLSVYYPNNKRIMEVPLELPDTFNRTKDGLLVRFTEDPTYGGEHTVSKTFKP